VNAHSAAANAKIGVLDSGIGGLSVLREIHRLMPGYPTCYVGDQAHLPYGPRSANEILTYVDAITQFLCAQGAAVIVLACHAASAPSLQALRQRYPSVPFVGIEPAIKPAIEGTKSGVIGVLTTRATADGALYRRVLERFGASARVITVVAPELVTLAEMGAKDTPEGEAVIKRYVEPLLEAGADHLVLACTHFPFLADTIQRLAGSQMTLVDPGPAVARQTAHVWPGTAPADAPDTYYTTGNPEGFRAMLHSLIGVEAPVKQLCWHESYGTERKAALSLVERLSG